MLDCGDSRTCYGMRVSETGVCVQGVSSFPASVHGKTCSTLGPIIATTLG